MTEDELSKLKIGDRISVTIDGTTVLMEVIGRENGEVQLKQVTE